MAGPAAGAAWARSDQPVFPRHDPTVPALLRHALDRFPENLAVATPDDRLTYRDLDRRSATLAGRLVEAGVAKGTHVGILLPNNAAWVVAWAAITRIGAVATPVNTFYRTPELAAMLRHADVQVLIATTRFANHDYVERLTRIADLDGQDGRALRLLELPQLRRISWWEDDDTHPWATGGIGTDLDGDASQGGRATVAELEADVVAADPMLVTYTSGSTGDPKGVVHGHGPLLRHARNLAAMSGLGPDDRIWTPMPLCWVGGFSFTLLRALSVGAAFVTQELFEPATTLRLLEAERVSFVSAWPNTSATLLDHPDFASTDLSHLRRGTFFEARPDGEKPADRGLVVTSLGMSETAGPHTFWTEEEDVAGAPEEHRGTFGHQVPGVEHRIVRDDGTDAPEGEEGEVWVRGYSLMLGLYKVERADAFDADGWYRTGDRGRFRDGWFFFTGRQTDLIKTKGSNVAPAEVEKALVGLDDVKAAYVFGVEHPDRGQDVVALLVTADDATPTPDAVVAELRDRLSSYKVPRHVFTIDADDVPFLTSQKPDRRSLAETAVELTAAARTTGDDA